MFSKLVHLFPASFVGLVIKANRALVDTAAEDGCCGLVAFKELEAELETEDEESSEVREEGSTVRELLPVANPEEGHAPEDEDGG